MIDFQHPDYKENISDWELTEHICNSEEVEQYLIILNPTDTSPENRQRNEQYKNRAVFYSVAGHTLEGLIGLIFAKYPQATIPSNLEYMLTNIDGSGVSIYQQSQITTSEILTKGRAGLYVSYPKTEGAISKAQLDEGGYSATVNIIEAEQIINWRTIKRGSETILSLVVISESVEEVGEDGYSIEYVTQLKELALIENVFTVREWRKDSKTNTWFVVSESIPTDSSGNTWDVIPFVFVGSVANTTEINPIPLYPLAKINVSHYRNSADYEDSVWYVGQAQPWMSGVTQSHVDMMKSNNMYVGSRNLLGVPSGEQFNFASAPPNPLVRQAMLDKLDMMIGLGARFIREAGVQKTATESGNDAKVQHSSLALVSSNVGEAYVQALKYAARYMGSPDTEIIYQPSMEFTSPTATSQDIQAMVAGFIQGAIPMSSYFRWLKNRDLVDSEKTIEEFSDEVDSSAPLALDEPSKPIEGEVLNDKEPQIDIASITEALVAAIKAIPAPQVTVEAAPVVAQKESQPATIVLNTGTGGKVIQIKKNSDGSMTATSSEV